MAPMQNYYQLPPARRAAGRSAKTFETSLRLWLRAFRVNYFSGLESDLTVRAVTKRLVRRSAAAAQSDAWAIVGGELISRRVVNINWTFDQIGTIWFRTDGYVCHFLLLMIG